MLRLRFICGLRLNPEATFYMNNAPLEGFFFKDFKNSYIPNILEEIYRDKVYEPYLAGKKDLIIADWGGNIGLTSYYFKDYAKQVYCVEPSVVHHEAIEKLIEFNKIKNIKLCKYAIAGENGTIKFYHPENVTMYSMENVMGAQDYEEVEAITPDEFFKREGIEHIDLLKLDVEGSEGKVITSAGFEAVAPKIDVIVGEHHSWDSMNQAQFKNTFEDLGFDFTWLPTEAQCFTAVRRK